MKNFKPKTAVEHKMVGCMDCNTPVRIVTKWDDGTAPKVQGARCVGCGLDNMRKAN